MEIKDLNMKSLKLILLSFLLISSPAFSKIEVQAGQTKLILPEPVGYTDISEMEELWDFAVHSEISKNKMLAAFYSNHFLNNYLKNDTVRLSKVLVLEDASYKDRILSKEKFSKSSALVKRTLPKELRNEELMLKEQKRINEKGISKLLGENVSKPIFLEMMEKDFYYIGVTSASNKKIEDKLLITLTAQYFILLKGKLLIIRISYPFENESDISNLKQLSKRCIS